MSDYTPITTFADKDALISGDPLKIIKGADFDPEFTAIQTAVATKIDTGGEGLSKTGTTLKLDYSGDPSATPAAADEFVITDASDAGAIKRVLFSALETALTHDNLTGVDANEHVDHTAVSMTTATDSGLSGGGTIAATRALSVDINGTTEQTVIDAPNDMLLMYDASAAGLKKVAIDDAVSAGTALANLLFPVGTVILRASDVDPNGSDLPGTWVSRGTAHSLLAVGTANGAGTVSGSNDVTVPVPQHNHTASFSGNALAAHTHDIDGCSDSNTVVTNTGVEEFSVGGGSGLTANDNNVSSVSAGTPSGSVTVDNEGTAAVTMDVTGATFKVVAWERTV